MGTKLQYAMNAIATTRNSDSAFSPSRIDDWDYFRNKGLKEDPERSLYKFEDSIMDRRMIEQQKLESIRKTMLLHEDIFKHQVRELHRLYSVQKMLMDDMRNHETTKQPPQQQRHSYVVVPMTTSTGPSHHHQHHHHSINYSNFFVDRHQPSTTTTGRDNKTHLQSVLLTENNLSSRETSGSGKMGFDLERPAAIEEEEEDLSTGISAIEEDQTGPSSYRAIKQNQIEEESDVELSLSIGGRCRTGKTKSRTKSERRDDQCGGSGGSNIDVGNSSAATTIDQQNKWLFKGLSLHRT